jgi:glutamyl-tRNA reductase
MQLKEALARAAAAGSLGAATHRLGAAALAVGKRVRTRTGISRHALSVVSVALEEMTHRLGPLAGRTVLVVGGGNTAQLALRHLASARTGVTGTQRVVVARDAEQSASLAIRHGATALPWDALEDALVRADAIVTATSAPAHVIDRPFLERVQARRGGAPLVIADLATPRDVDPAAGDLPGVSLFDIDRVAAAAEANRALRAAETAAAEAIIAEHVDRYFSWFTARQTAPTTSALVAHAAAIRDAELARALAQMSSLSPSDERAVRALAARLVSKLIHAPIATLGQHPEAGNMAAALRELFQLGGGTPPRTEPASHDHTTPVVAVRDVA